MMLKKLLAVGLSTLLVACSASRSRSPEVPSPANPEHFVLVLQAHPDGQVTHAWQPAERFDFSAYRFRSANEARSGGVLPAAARPRDCDQENQECYQKCMSRPLPPGYGSYTSPRKMGGKSEFCRRECQQAYDDCRELERLRPQEFTTVDGLIDWLKRHRKEVLVGSVITVAGIAFVVISAGAGLLVLAPVVLMTSSESQPEDSVAGGAQ
ncbi:hypothetical protein [Hyalangium minutum]|uniref:hypothetical protein n=1 Tax=Hyalangium minutum TaxID=394096 RepID=UPI0005C690A7|nr:hypothetical protein [Hyalangium minutum]